MANSVRGARSKAREFALQGLYQWRVAGNPVSVIAEQVREAKGFERADAEHFEALLLGCASGADSLGASFTPFLDRALKELSPIEYSLLLIGAYEMTHCLDIPYKVIINEAVELAKRYGGTEGYKYVNGVLDKLAGDLRPAEAGPRAPAVRAPRGPAVRRPRTPGTSLRTPRRRGS